MRNYLEAIKSRVVVYDGGMGATLEQFDLSSEDYGGLPGKCHEALVLHRPDVIEEVHRSMVEAGAAGVETDTFPAARLKLHEGGVDVLLIETAQDILEVKAAVFGCRDAFGRVGREVPIQTQVSLLPNGGK